MRSSPRSTERLVAHECRRLQNRVTEPPGLALPHEVHLGDLGGGVHGVQPAGVTLLLQRGLQLGDAVEEVLDGRLVPAGHHEHLGQPGPGGLLDDVLERRPIDDREQLLGHGFGRRQEARTHPGNGDDGLPRRTRVLAGHAGQPSYFDLKNSPDR
jgi:hypothetical protein